MKEWLMTLALTLIEYAIMFGIFYGIDWLLNIPSSDINFLKYCVFLILFSKNKQWLKDNKD